MTSKQQEIDNLQNELDAERNTYRWATAIEGWFFGNLAALAVALFLVVVWQFIHWAAQPDYRCYAAVDSPNGSMFYHCDK